jgi:hypothetical protein
MREPGNQRNESSLARRFERFFAFLGYSIFCVLLAAALVELGAFAIWSAKHGRRPSRQEKLGSTSPAYAAYPWAAEFWKEEQQRRKALHGDYVPFRVWSVAQWHGKYVNADSSETGTWRRTSNPSRPNCEKQPIQTIWMFGGSTLYGSGVPDWATIPSYLSQNLNAESGVCAKILNFGVEGYVSNQELMLLTEQLKAGRRPDIVIFYDGANDSYIGMFAPGIATAHWDYVAIKARVEGSIVGKLEFLRNSFALRLIRESFARRMVSVAENAGIANSRGIAVLDNFEANLRIARALGEAYGFKVYCFWQPSLAYGSKPLAPYEQELVNLDANSPEGSAFPKMSVAYGEAERRAARSGDFVFLGRLFDAAQPPLYLDRWMHLGPQGNELAAKAIAGNIEERQIKPEYREQGAAALRRH